MTTAGAPLQILLATPRLLAVAKPAGPPVVPGRGGAAPLLAAVEAHLGAKAWVVHRLDAPTSGVVLFAKDADAHRRACAAFAERRVRKVYRAAVLGTALERGEISLALKQFGSGRVAPAADGKPAKTRYRRLAAYARASLLEVVPETGRRHQIRVHLNAVGHPVLGDPLYGAARPVGGAARLLLHAQRLAFEDDALGAVDVLCPPPTDFEQAWAAFTSE